MIGFTMLTEVCIYVCNELEALWDTKALACMSNPCFIVLNSTGDLTMTNDTTVILITVQYVCFPAHVEAWGLLSSSSTLGGCPSCCR